MNVFEKTKKTPEIKNEVNTQQETNEIKNEVINTNLDDLDEKIKTPENKEYRENKLKTHESLKWTTMYTSLLKYFNNDEKKVEEFSINIDKPVRTYLKQEIKDFPIEIIDNMGMGIQYAMMDMMAAEGQDKMAELFAGFWKMNTEKKDWTVDKSNIKSIFDGMLWFFSKSSWFFNLANRLTNLTTYMKFHEELKTTKSLLTNANEVRKLLSATPNKWDKAELTEGKSPQEVGLLIEIDDKTGEAELKAIANKIKMDNKMIESLQKAPITAEKFLDKRWEYKEKILDLAKKWESIMEFWIPGLFTLGELFTDKKWWTIFDMFDKDKWIGKIVNFVLKILWFWGIDWFRKEYIQAKMEWQMSPGGKQYIKDVISSYQQEVTNPGYFLPAADKQTLAIVWLSKDPAASKYQDKIPQDFDKLEATIQDKLSTNPEKIISLETAKEMGLSIQEGKEKAYTLTSFDKKSFSDNYLKKKIPELLQNAELMDKVEKSNNPQAEFMLALLGLIVAGQVFIDWVKFWIQTASMYPAAVTITENIQQGEKQGEKQEDKQENKQENKTEVLTSEPLVYEDLIKENKVEFIEKVKKISNDLWINPNRLMIVMYKESWLNHTAVNSKSKATGLIQFLPSTAKWLWTTTESLKNMTNVEQLDYVEKYLSPQKGKLTQVKSFEDLYTLIFYPAALGKDDDYKIWWTAVAQQNPGFDKDKDNQITAGEYRRYIKDNIIAGLPEEYKDQIV